MIQSGNSASAAEVLAAAFQEQRRGLVLGQTSAGAVGESMVKATRPPSALKVPSCSVRLLVSAVARPDVRSSS